MVDNGARHYCISALSRPNPIIGFLLSYNHRLQTPPEPVPDRDCNTNQKILISSQSLEESQCIGVPRQQSSGDDKYLSSVWGEIVKVIYPIIDMLLALPQKSSLHLSDDVWRWTHLKSTTEFVQEITEHEESATERVIDCEHNCDLLKI